MPLPNATDLGTFQSRSRAQDARFNARKARRDSGFMIAVSATTIPALLLAYVWTTGMVLPAIEKFNHHHQEITAQWTR